MASKGRFGLKGESILGKEYFMSTEQNKVLVSQFLKGLDESLSIMEKSAPPSL